LTAASFIVGFLFGWVGAGLTLLGVLALNASGLRRAYDKMDAILEGIVEADEPEEQPAQRRRCL
jgi:hypothetical protein